MRLLRRLTLTLVCSFSLLALPAGAGAQGQYGAALGELRLSFDSSNQVDRLDVLAGEAFDFYVFGRAEFVDPQQNNIDGINAWEARVELSPQILVLERELFRNPLTCEGGVCGDDWMVILNGCVLGSEGRTRLLRYRAQLLNDVSDQTIRILPASLSSFDGTAPGWAACIKVGDPLNDLHPFASGWSNELIINSSVATQSKSWAATKALYD